ncbi:MGMT family protein [bacterium]|nr:MAG: MGMT family protein [bacterium]
MDTYRIMTVATHDGEFHIIIDNHNIARASGFGTAADLIKRHDPSLDTTAIKRVDNHPYQNYVLDYYNGDTTALDKIRRSQSGTEFQKRVWHAMSSIPYGQTVSYKQLADISGNPAAIRAAGTICGLNRLVLLLPCHRILKSDGSIGSYLYGSAIKESLLRLEGAII